MATLWTATALRTESAALQMFIERLQKHEWDLVVRILTLLQQPFGRSGNEYTRALIDVNERDFPGATGRISYAAFRDSESLRTVALPPLVTDLGYHCFGNCQRLVNVSFSTLLTTIGEGAFLGCIKLRSVRLAQCPRLKKIGHQAFRGCLRLSSIELPAHSYPRLPSIELSSFRGCRLLTKIILVAGQMPPPPEGLLEVSEDDQIGFPWPLEDVPTQTKVYLTIR